MAQPSEDGQGLQRPLLGVAYSLSWQMVTLTEHLKGAHFSLLFEVGDTGAEAEGW